MNDHLNTEDHEQDEAREALAETFRRSIGDAPPPPALLLRKLDEAAPPRLFVRAPALASAAAILLLAIGLGLVPQREVDASPSAVLARASSRFLELEDARLRMTMQSGALDFLLSLSDEHDPSRPGFRPTFWMLMQKPNRFLVWGEELESTVETKLQTSGFDGTTAWTYIEDENVVEIQTVADGVGLGDLDLTEYLTFGFVRELQAQQEYDIEEVTGPADRRAGRRSFQLERLGEEEGLVFEEATITIDARTELIERYRVDLQLGPFSLMTFEIELDTINRGVDPRRFRFEQHVPDGVTVRHVEPDESSAGINLKLSTGVKKTVGGDD